MDEMTADQRREAIAQRLAENPSVSQLDLAAEFGCSRTQIQRDLRKLGVQGGAPLSVVPKVQARAGVSGSAGQALVAKIRAELDGKGLEPDAREEGLLDEIRATADLIAAAQARIDRDGIVFPPASKGGPPRNHPLLAEIRGQRAVLARLLSQVSLEETAGKNPVKSRAAQTRWAAHSLKKSQGAGHG